MADPLWGAVPNNDPYYVDLEFDDLMNVLTDSIDPSLENIPALLDGAQPPASPQNGAVSSPQNHALLPPSTAENSGVPVAYVYNLLDNPFPMNEGQSNNEALQVTPSVPFGTPNRILGDDNGLMFGNILHSSNTQIPNANSSLGEVVSNPRNVLPTNPLSNFSGGESSAFPNLGQGSSSSMLPGSSDLRNIPMRGEASSGPRNQLSGGESSAERQNISRRLDLPRGVNPPLLHMLLIRPLPTPIPSACWTCVTLRQIIFISPLYLIKLEIHGSEGAITHALQESRANAFTNSEALNHHKYRTFDFSGKSVPVVKWLLEYYCKVRKQQGFRMVRDPMRPFYDALCEGVGVDFESQEWDEVFTYPEEYIIPQRRLRDFIDETEVAVGQDPLPEQRKRAANMRLDDFRPFLHMEIEEAAAQLRFCVTVVKQLCRRFRIDRWPARKIKNLKWKIELLQENVGTFGEEYKKYFLKEIERLKFEIGQLARLEPSLEV